MSNCACGDPTGTNPECERCRLMSRIAELEQETQKLNLLIVQILGYLNRNDLMPDGLYE